MNVGSRPLPVTGGLNATRFTIAKPRNIKPQASEATISHRARKVDEDSIWANVMVNAHVPHQNAGARDQLQAGIWLAQNSDQTRTVSEL